MTALKVLIVLALIVIPGGILLQSSGSVFHGVSTVLSPASSLFSGLLSGTAPTATPDDRTHTGVLDPDLKLTPQNQITVRVHDGNGTSIGSATVMIGSQTLTTDGSGNAVFTLDKGARVNIQVSARGYDAYNTSYTPGADATVDVILVLTPTPMPIP